MSKHTPGPWRMHGFAQDGVYPGIFREVLDEHGNITRCTQVMPFFDCDPAGMHYARHMADKALIESAPDLIAIVKRMEVAIGNYCCANVITHDDMEDDDEGKELLDACNAADELLKRLS